MKPLSKAKLKLVEATIESLMEEGVDGCSVRKIAEKAQVSTGLINYHFGSIDNLIAAAYSYLAFTFLDSAIEASMKSEGDARQQLSAFIKEIFSGQVLQRRVLRAWVVFWGLIDSSPAIQSAQSDSNSSFTSYLEQLFMQLQELKGKQISPKMAALGLTALIDGLWLEMCLEEGAIKPLQCRKLCEHWVDSI